MIHIVLDTKKGRQAGRIYSSASEARRHWPNQQRYTLDTVELFCLGTDSCTETAVTVVSVGDVKEEAATHHVPVCRKHTDPSTWSAA